MMDIAWIIHSLSYLTQWGGGVGIRGNRYRNSGEEAWLRVTGPIRIHSLA